MEYKGSPPSSSTVFPPLKEVAVGGREGERGRRRSPHCGWGLWEGKGGGEAVVKCGKEEKPWPGDSPRQNGFALMGGPSVRSTRHLCGGMPYFLGRSRRRRRLHLIEGGREGKSERKGDGGGKEREEGGRKNHIPPSLLPSHSPSSFFLLSLRYLSSLRRRRRHLRSQSAVSSSLPPLCKVTVAGEGEEMIPTSVRPRSLKTGRGERGGEGRTLFTFYLPLALCQPFLSCTTPDPKSVGGQHQSNANVGDDRGSTHPTTTDWRRRKRKLRSKPLVVAAPLFLEVLLLLPL